MRQGLNPYYGCSVAQVSETGFPYSLAIYNFHGIGIKSNLPRFFVVCRISGINGDIITTFYNLCNLPILHAINASAPVDGTVIHFFGKYK